MIDSFPGGVFDAEGVSLIPGRPDLNQATIDAMPHRSMAARGLSVRDGQLAIGRVWLLDAGATLDHVPAPERQAALAMMREGYAVMLLAPDPQTEVRMLNSLLYMLDEVSVSGHFFGHA